MTWAPATIGPGVPAGTRGGVIAATTLPPREPYSLAEIEAKLLSATGEQIDWERLKRRAVFESIATADFLHLLNVIQSVTPDSLRRHMHVELLMQWAKSDAPAALMVAEGMGDQMEKRSVIATLMMGWIVADARGAADWLRARNDSYPNLNLWGRIPERLARQDPELASSYLEYVPAGRERDRAFASILTGLAIRYWSARIVDVDAAAAIDLAGVLPAGSDREQAFGMVAPNWAQRDHCRRVNCARRFSPGWWKRCPARRRNPRRNLYRRCQPQWSRDWQMT